MKNLIQINNIGFKYEGIHLNECTCIQIYRYYSPYITVSAYRLLSLLNIFEIRGRYDDANAVIYFSFQQPIVSVCVLKLASTYQVYALRKCYQDNIYTEGFCFKVLSIKRAGYMTQLMNIQHSLTQLRRRSLQEKY